MKIYPNTPNFLNFSYDKQVKNSTEARQLKVICNPKNGSRKKFRALKITLAWKQTVKMVSEISDLAFQL